MNEPPPTRYVITETRGPVATVEDLTAEITPETIHSRIEQFECPHCGKPWQRLIGERPGFFRQPQFCHVDGPNDFELEAGWKARGCGRPLPTDLEPGDRVSLERWDATVPPSSRFGDLVVVRARAVRNCQSGFLVSLAEPDAPDRVVADLDRAWLIPRPSPRRRS
jgi:hypothetical protein